MFSNSYNRSHKSYTCLISPDAAADTAAPLLLHWRLPLLQHADPGGDGRGDQAVLEPEVQGAHGQVLHKVSRRLQ